MTETLSRREARRIQLVAQGLLGPRIAGGPAAVLDRLRAVQLDTISVLVRSHELVPLARLGPTPRARIEAAYWGAQPPRTFEYWYHAACVLPIDEWPAMEFRRKERRARGFRWHRLENALASCDTVLGELSTRGPLTANELGGAKRGGPWWDWSDTKIAVEWLLDIGDVICTMRRGFQRVYDLPERVLGPEHRAGLDRDEAIVRLLTRAAGALGVSTARDLSTYTGVPAKDVSALLGSRDLGLLPVSVEGWKEPAVAVAEWLNHPSVSGTARCRARLISPFDSLVWDRPRVERVFGFRQRLEAYVPKPKRVHGYFAMPVLAGDRLIGRVDPAREATTLVARRVQLEPGTPLASGARAIAIALGEAARWVGSDSVAVEASEPAELRKAVLAALG